MKERTYNELLKLEKEGHKMKDSSHETEPSSNFLNNSSKNKSVNYLKEQKE